VAPSTRQRILDAAAELGWYPNAAARALSGSSVSACGLVLARSTRILAVEPFFMGLIAGMESKLSAESIGLTLQVVDTVDEEVVVLRRWWAERRVDGVFVVDLRTDDPRIPVLEQLQFPAVVIGGPDGTGDLAALWGEDSGTMAAVVRYLAKLGHRRIARVAGNPAFRHTVHRTEAFEATITGLGLHGSVVNTDFMAETGAEATRRLLLDSEPPTAIVYDNDILAVAGLGVAHELDLTVPGDVSIVAWDDSAYCSVVHPPLTAVRGDIPALGVQAAGILLDLLKDGTVRREARPRSVLTPRGSTGPPRPSR
jgi:DNA-binding LacI/PurR family transcriptional regulator